MLKRSSTEYAAAPLTSTPATRGTKTYVFFLDHFHPGFFVRLHCEVHPNQEQLFDNLDVVVFDSQEQSC